MKNFKKVVFILIEECCLSLSALTILFIIDFGCLLGSNSISWLNPIINLFSNILLFQLIIEIFEEDY